MSSRLPTLTPARLRQLWYVPILATAMALMLVRLLLLARLLEVPAFAQYSAGLLISSSFGIFACLGLYSLLQRDLPVAIVRGRERAGALLLVQCAGVSGACATVLIAATALLRPTVAGLTPSMLMLALLHGLAMQLFLLATLESRSRGEPLRFARQNLQRAIAILGVGAAAAWLLRSAAAVLALEAVLSLLLAGAFGARQLRMARSRTALLATLAVRRLALLPWRASLALLTTGALAFAAGNADRWVAAEMLDPVSFATYAFAWTVLLVAQSAQALIHAAVFPMLARRFATSGDQAAQAAGARLSMTLLVGGMALLLPAWLLLDAAVVLWFEPYAAARSVLPQLLVVAVLRLSDFWSSVLIVTGRESLLLRVNVVGILAGLAAWGAAVALLGLPPSSPQAAAGLALALAIFSYVAAAWAALRVRALAADGAMR